MVNHIRSQLQHPMSLFLIGMVALIVLGSIIYIPDSYEYFLIADCFDGQSFLDCAKINMTFRPPLLSFFLWPLPLEALPLLAIISISGSAVFLTKMTKTHAVWTAVLAIYCTQHHPILADARIFLLIFLFGAWYSLLQLSNTRNAVLTGIAIGSTVWIRPEAQLGIVFFICYAFFVQRQYIQHLLLGIGLIIFAWFSWLSWHAGQWVWAPRYWEGYMLDCWEFMPRRAMLQMGGMGIYNPPMRSIWMEYPPYIPKAVFDTSNAMSWIQTLWTNSPLIWTTGLLSTLYLCFSKPRMGWAFVMIAMVNLLTIFIPQAQNPIFIESNMMVAKICLLSAIAVTTAERFPRLAYILPLSLLLLDPSSNMKPGIERTDIGIAATQWLQSNTAVDSTVTSTFENAPMIWLAERDWQQWKNPWDPLPHPEYILINHWEAFLVSLPLCPQQKLEAFFQKDKNWIAIHSCLE